MTIQIFLRELNWRLMLVHFVAGWFLMHSFSFLVYLLQPQKAKDLISILGDKRAINNYILSDNATRFINLMAFNYYLLLVFLGGLLISFIVSLIISIKRKWFWFNAFVVFLLLLLVTHYEDEQQLRWGIMGLGKKFQYPILYLSIVGFTLFSLSLFFFFFKPFHRFIDKGQFVNSPQTEATEII